MQKIRGHLDLFSGIGGFSLGLKNTGMEPEWLGFSDIDKYANELFKRRFPNAEQLGSVTDVSYESLGGRPIDLLTGGFPCQAFSLAGKRKGFSDTHEVHFFLKSKEFYEITLPIKNPYPVYYSKMLKVYLTTMMDEHLLQYIEFCPTLIIPLSANWLILGGGYPKIENESTSLVDIMETQVDEKYFLSETAIRGIQKSNFIERKPVDKNKVCRTLKVGGDTPCVEM